MEEGSTALRVSQPGDGAAPLVIPSLKAPKNGYAFIYLSNENDDAVYFDDFTVSYTRGKITEENHYYAFGLRISSISSRKYDGGLEGSLKNEFLYNDKELWDDAELNWYDYGFRNYDAQIARFTQLDPLTWDYPELTNYQYASNDPIANVDLDGLEKLSSIIDKSEFFLNKAGEIAVETLAPAVITAKLPAAAAKTVSFAAKAGALLKSAGTAAASFGKNFWNEDVTPSVTWFNRNLNPIYGIFNGINSQFTGQDFLTGEPMSRADGIGDVVLSAIPALKVEGAVLRQFGKQALKGAERIAAKGGRGLWKLTDEGATAIKNHRTWGKFYKGSDGLWWSEDITKHGASQFKVFKETNKGLEWIHNADKYGDFIKNQHKSPTGTFIHWGELKTIK